MCLAIPARIVELKGDKAVDEVPLEAVIENEEAEAVPADDQIKEMAGSAESEKQIKTEVEEGQTTSQRDVVEEMETALAEDQGPEGKITAEDIAHEEEVLKTERATSRKFPA